MWNDESAQTNCQSSVDGACRVFPLPGPLRLDLRQDGVALSGTMTYTLSGASRTGPFQGYIAADLGIVGQTTDLQLRLEKTPTGFSGYFVVDTFNNSTRVKTERFAVSNVIQ